MLQVCQRAYDVPTLEETMQNPAVTCTTLRPKPFIAFALFHEFTHAAAGTSRFAGYHA